jgi:hypothetical protein
LFIITIHQNKNLLMKKFIKKLFTPFHRVNKLALLGTAAVAEIATIVMITQILFVPKVIVLTLWYLSALLSIPLAIASVFVCYCVIRELRSFVGTCYTFH